MSRSATKDNRSIRRDMPTRKAGYFALQALLQEFASALLPHGMTPRLFGELARSAFVNAAAQRSRLRNGRVNQSRIAARTGLSRADVKRLLGNLGYPAAEMPPVERVIDGWQRDRAYTDKRGKPRRLTISGRRPDFVRLSQKYAGDIPYRAILDELESMGVVIVSLQHVQLVHPKKFTRTHNYSFLSPLAGPFKDGLAIVSTKEPSRRRSSIRRLHLHASTEIDMTVVRSRCEEAASLMLDGLRHSLDQSVTLPTRKKKSAHIFTVTILLASNDDTRPTDGSM